MDGWTIIVLPTLHMDKAQDSIDVIANWVKSRGFDTRGVGISSRIVRFKESSEAMFFRLSFNS